MYQIRALRAEDLEALRRFTDQAIGEGYYSLDEVREVLRRSTLNGEVFTLVLVRPDEATGQLEKIVGARLTYPPGQWNHGKGKGLSPAAWPHPLQRTAYFQSLFLADELRGQGWGGRLSRAAIQLLRQKTSTLGIVTHSWKESPDNSSTRYLQKLGFQKITEYPEYWRDVDYNCTRCLKPPCLCTAQEMYLDLTIPTQDLKD
ncbi:MAG TPA: GNAT family N-acetyltransferase [Pseudobdellovibrionaceae bacterium]|nr:GNAT family N-acetyltransferase [Pseudobdellovibrionaceae bacterium]